MTYILGSRCADGVVLIADTKFTVGEYGLDVLYDNKLFGEFSGIIIGFSGMRGTFELFKNNIIDYVKTTTGKLEIIPLEKFIFKISEITHTLSVKYAQDYDIILAIRSQPSQLKYMFADGKLESINGFKAIGTGSPFGSFYLKRYWNENMTMEQVAELGYFIIKYINTFELDFTVGLNTHKPYNEPQIWFIPNNAPDYTNADPRIQELLKKFEERTNTRIKKIKDETFF